MSLGEVISVAELKCRLSYPMVAERASVVCDESAAPYLMVALDEVALDSDSDEGLGSRGEILQPSCPVIGVFNTTAAVPLPECVDVIVRDGEERDAVVRAIEQHPVASTVLVQLLRHNASVSVADGLLAESLAYSTLQQGAEFQAWLGAREVPERPPESRPVFQSADAEPLLIERVENALRLTLNRPGKRNAYSAELHAALVAGLQLPMADERIDWVTIDGNGPAFCGGGDLTEFGSVSDAAVAHLSRSTRSAGRLLHGLSRHLDKHLMFELHGACIGAGIELPAFARRVVATRDAFFQLPEVSMGLVPGAGGTVSITHRVGRLKAAYLALSNERIDAERALSWGLIDEVR